MSGLPTDVTGQFTTTGSGPSGTLALTGGSTVAAGSYPATVTVTLAGQSVSNNLTVTSAVVAKVSKTTDTTLGVNGVLKEFMSTSFQIAEWSGNYFGTNTTARETTLAGLQPQHIRLQAVSEGVPMVADKGTASDWSFTILDQTVQPILAVGDQSPEFQIAVAPTWMCNSSGQLDVANHVKDFAAYAANLVRYYNKGGFTYAGTHFQSASSQPITWWGIFNEPAYNGITPAEYVTIYNTVVPAMLAVDPTIKFSAIEFSGSVLGTGWSSDPEVYLPMLFASASAGGLNAQVNSVSNHFYSTCNQLDTDATVMATIPKFAAVESYIYQEIKSRSDLSSVPIWTTENNVNADYSNGNGKSTCNPTQTFVTDQRGSSPFFAAWRPYMFSQLGKAGNQALYQWAYSGDAQYGEVDGSGTHYLSYWVDKTLENFFPYTSTSSTQNILELTSTDTPSVETLVTENSGNGTVTVMVVDHAVAASTDDNGSGSPRTVVVDLSNYGTFSAASLLTIDSATSVTNGPTAVGVTPATRINVTLPGYGVALLTLTP
jgi:hypothetical protein